MRTRRNREDKVARQSIQTTKKDNQPQSFNFQSPIQPQKNNRSRNLQKLAQVQQAREGFNFGKISISGSSSVQGPRDYSVGGISKNKIIQTQVDNLRATQRQNKPFNLVNNFNSSRIQKRTDIDENQLAVNPHNYQVNNRSSTPTIQRVIEKDVKIGKLTDEELKRQKELELEISRIDISSLVKEKMDEHLTSLDEMQKTVALLMVLHEIKSNNLEQNEGKEAIDQALTIANNGDFVDRDQVISFVYSLIKSGVQNSYKLEKELSKLKEKAELTTKKFYSHIDPTKEITSKQGVISSIAVGDDGMRHVYVYIEYLTEDGEPKSICTYLEYGDDKKKVIIKIEDMENETIMDGLKDKQFKRSWMVNMTQVKAALNKAKTTQQNSSEYIYVHKGSRVLGSMRRFLIDQKKSVNCARYVNKILKAAGISSGLGIGYVKTPHKVATGNSYIAKVIKERTKKFGRELKGTLSDRFTI